MCEIGDFLEPFDAQSEWTQKARKEHKCDCCDGIIRKGEIYTRHFSKFEGECNFEKACAACDMDREVFAQAHHGIRTTPSYSKELISECLDEPEDFASMLKWSRIIRKMTRRRQAAVGPRRIG